MKHSVPNCTVASVAFQCHCGNPPICNYCEVLEAMCEVEVFSSSVCGDNTR